MEGRDWFCDDCLNHRPSEQSIYIQLKKDDNLLLCTTNRLNLTIDGDLLELYQFLYKSVHSVFKQKMPSIYNGVQLVMILSEISHSASYPLCSSVFHLLRYTIDVISLRGIQIRN